MWAVRTFQRKCLKSFSVLTNRTHLLRVSPTGNFSNAIQSKVPNLSYPTPFLLLDSAIGTRHMSTSKGRSMRSKVEKRMRRETGKTLREIRRAKKLRKKLMTEEERLIYNLRRAKKKVSLLLQKLKKYELPELPAPRHDPELLTAEQLQAYRKIGFRNRNYCEVGVRGVFGGVVQNMHMHWKFHETVQVYCDNFPKEKIKEMATMLARLSGGIVVNIHNVKTIIMFRGRNYRQPKNLIPLNTLTKRKALFKARFEQALESQKLNIKKIEQLLRRKGVNPEDPIAMASIQRVAATFFRAIDEKQGTPYVFKDEKPMTTEVNDGPEEHAELQAEDSDQEELDRFIKEIEDAADQEWAAEEAAEKEESSRIRYWKKDDYGTHGRSSNRGESEYRSRRDWSESESRRRTTNARKWESDGESIDSDAEEWSDDEIIDDVSAIDSDDGSDYEAHQRSIQRPKGHRDAQVRAFKTIDIRGSRGTNNKVDKESDCSEDSDDGMWESGEEEHDPGKAKDPHYNYISSSDDDSDTGSTVNVRRGDLKKKKFDESWDSD